MLRITIILVNVSILVLSVILTSSLEAKIVHKERSLYRNIMVTQDSKERCLLFTIKRRARSRQSCQSLEDPKQLVFRYAQVTMSSFALQSNPKDILVLGLGGGSLPMTYVDLLPEANITAVEIDTAVTKVAKKYFGLKTSDKLKVAEKDARVFVKRALRKKQKFDLVVLDAFNGDYIPEHLMTKEFLEEVRSLLNENGVVVANTFSTSDLYDHESATYKEVFSEFLNFKIPHGNRIIIATNEKLPPYDVLIDQAQALDLPLADYGVSLLESLSLIVPYPDWNKRARILTDQFAPANLLQGRD
jgi:spermidine synthase